MIEVECFDSILPGFVEGDSVVELDGVDYNDPADDDFTEVDDVEEK